MLMKCIKCEKACKIIVSADNLYTVPSDCPGNFEFTKVNVGIDESEIDHILQRVKTELMKANKKFPLFNSTHEGYGVIKEELDEMWDEIKANLTSRSILECVQLAAMAVKYIQSMERGKHAEQQ